MNKGQILKEISEKSFRKTELSFRVGDKVQIFVKIKEEKRERVQMFEGFVVSIKHGTGINGRFTVRRVGKDGIATERIFPLHSDFIEKIDIIKSHKVRRAKLNFVKGMAGNMKLPELKGKAKGKSMSFKPTLEKKEDVAPVEQVKIEENKEEKAEETPTTTEKSEEQKDTREESVKTEGSSTEITEEASKEEMKQESEKTEGKIETEEKKEEANS